MSKSSCGKRGSIPLCHEENPAFSHHALAVLSANICDNKHLFNTLKGRFQSPHIKRHKEQYLTLKQTNDRRILSLIL